MDDGLCLMRYYILHLLLQIWPESSMNTSPQGCSSLRAPYSEALSTVQAHNKWTQPCTTSRIHRCTLRRVLSMCLLFCSGAGMCGTRWHHHTGQLTTRPHRDEFPWTLCTPTPPPLRQQWVGLTSRSLQWASVLVQWTTIIRIYFKVGPYTEKKKELRYY